MTDEDCGCAAAIDVAASPIVCTLGATDVAGRIASWQAALAPVVSRVPIDGGVRLMFPSDAELGDLAELAAAEQACCRFLQFAITIDSRGVALEVTGSPDAMQVIDSLFGAAT